jgi:hypothetical protein
MHLLLRRSHRTGWPSGKVIYGLDILAHFTPAEVQAVARYRLAGTRLYQRMEVADRGSGLLGVLFRYTFRATNLKVTVRDLVSGKRVEVDDLLEILALEDQIRISAHTFKEVLRAAVNFDGRDILDL